MIVNLRNKMSKCRISKKSRYMTEKKFKMMNGHEDFLSRINKTLYYGKLPTTERFSLPVSELAAELFSEAKYGRSLDRLRLEEAAEMSRNACISPCSLVLALLYLERLKVSNTEYMRQVPPSELFLVTMMVASKFLHDDGEEDEVFNDEWATSAGIDVKEINRYEKNFLRAMKWEVFVTEKAFWERLRKLEKEIALLEGLRRGWFSYTDMDRLLDAVDVTALVQAVFAVSAVCLTSYTVSLLALVGSAFIVSHIPGNAMTPATRDLATPSHLAPHSLPRPLQEQEIMIVDTNSILSSLDTVDHLVVRESPCAESNNTNIGNVLQIKDNSSMSTSLVNTGFDVQYLSWKLVQSILDWAHEINWLPSSHIKINIPPKYIGITGNHSNLDWAILAMPWVLQIPSHTSSLPSVEIATH